MRVIVLAPTDHRFDGGAPLELPLDLPQRGRFWRAV
jgi:hypothetical protein